MQRIALQTAKLSKYRKCVKNADNADKTRAVPEKCASAKELSLVDLANVICSAWTRNGEIRSTGLLLATFNKRHILTYKNFMMSKPTTKSLDS